MQQLAEFSEFFAESSQIICGNIAGYPRGPLYVLVECSAEGLPWNVQRRLHSDLCKIYTIPVDCGWPLATKEVKFSEDDFADSQRLF